MHSSIVNILFSNLEDPKGDLAIGAKACDVHVVLKQQIVLHDGCSVY